MAKQLGLFYFTLFLLFGLTGVFLAFDARHLSVSLSPAVPAICGVLFIFTVAVLFRASFSDPGILPRANRTELEWLAGEFFSMFFSPFVSGVKNCFNHFIFSRV